MGKRQGPVQGIRRERQEGRQTLKFFGCGSPQHFVAVRVSGLRNVTVFCKCLMLIQL